MAEPRRTRGRLQVHVDYLFDRLHDSKLAQAYGILVPVRERPVGGSVSCVTLRIVVSPVSARPAPLHGRASSVRCVDAVWLRPAPQPATSARAKNGSRPPCRHW